MPTQPQATPLPPRLSGGLSWSKHLVQNTTTGSALCQASRTPCVLLLTPGGTHARGSAVLAHGVPVGGGCPCEDNSNRSTPPISRRALG